VTPPPPEPEIAKVEDAAPTEEFQAWIKGDDADEEQA
jgi:hypothetical protein